MKPVLKLSSMSVEVAVFQTMADSGMKEVRKSGAALAKKVRAAAPVGPRRRRRSAASKLYGPLKGAKTKFATRGKRTRSFRDGKWKWQYKVERAVLETPFYGYFQDKGWNARTGKRAYQQSSFKSVREQLTGKRFIPGSGYVTDTIKNFVR